MEKAPQTFDGFNITFDTNSILSLLKNNDKGNNLIVTILVSNITNKELFQLSKTVLLAWSTDLNHVAIHGVYDNSDMTMFPYPNQEPYNISQPSKI